MKKTACLSLVCASLAAFAADTTVDTGNQMGVLKVTENETNYLLVAVPWNEFGTGNADVKIETLVNPDQLKAGDKLYVANGTSYNVFKIQDNTWVGCATATVGANGTISETTPPPTSTTVKRGNAVWLYRQNPSTKSSFYLLGQKPEAGAVQVEVAAGNNLVASPAVGGLDLSTWNGKNGDADEYGCKTGDSIRINGNDGTAKNYAYSETKGWMLQTTGGWKQVTDKDVVDADKVIPAGRGFWYRAKASGKLTF